MASVHPCALCQTRQALAAANAIIGQQADEMKALQDKLSEWEQYGVQRCESWDCGETALRVDYREGGAVEYFCDKHAREEFLDTSYAHLVRPGARCSDGKDSERAP
jgi:hypothetical protein